MNNIVDCDYISKESLVLFECYSVILTVNA